MTRLPVDMTWADAEGQRAEALLALVRGLSKGSGRLRASGLAQKLATKTSCTELEVLEAFRQLNRQGFLEYVSDARGLPVSGFITVKQDTQKVDPAYGLWRSNLDAAGLSPAAVDALIELAPRLADLEAADRGRLAGALGRMEKLASVLEPDAGFNISARKLLGGSKILAKLPRAAVSAMGLPLEVQQYSPKYVVCAGPSQPEAVLLVENPRAFENAVQSGLTDRVAAVCTFGFGLGYLTRPLVAGYGGWGDPPIQLVRSGQPPGIERLFSNSRLLFWGDLDRAALLIYRHLRSSFSHLRLSAIYEIMISLSADADLSHPYAGLFEKAGQLPFELRDEVEGADSAFVRTWLACRDRAVDQEAVGSSEILQLGSERLAV